MATQSNRCQICGERCQVKYCTKHSREIDHELRRLVDGARTALRAQAVTTIAHKYVDEMIAGGEYA